MDRFEKQSYEEFVIETNFSTNFVKGEKIIDQSVSGYDSTGNDVSNVVINQATVDNNLTKVSALVRAGSQSNSPYKIVFRCTTSRGHKWEYDVQMVVKEI